MKKRIGGTAWATRMMGALALFMALSAVLMMSARPVAAQTQLPCVINHTVQPGDYIAKIGRQYGVSPSAILAYNPQIYHPNLIYPGQILYIPMCGQAPPYVPPSTQPPYVPPTQPPGTGYPPSTCRAYHYVAPGQTMFGIASYYNTSPWTIAQANGILNLNLIYAGTSLCIP